MTYTISYEQETDGRWIAEIEALPGVMAYGATRREEIGPRMLARIAKQTGLRPEDL
jgi:hypothetical protein